MTRFNPRLIRHAVATVAVGMALPLATIADHSWGNYHWARTSNPFTLKLGDNVSTAWDSYLATTSSDWSVSSVLDTVIVAGTTKPRQCRATSGRAEICNASYGSNGWLGLATIYASGDHITKGTVKLNDTYFNTATYNTPAWRNLVMCQEVGHMFGLAHQDENFNNPNLGTCMDYTSNPDSNQHPNAHDYEQLEIIYAHTDSTTTVGQSISQPNAMDVDFDTPERWGREIHRSADGRHSVFELDFGAGNKIIRHVLWAEPRGHGRD